jgi:hypothetical protein
MLYKLNFNKQYLGTFSSLFPVYYGSTFKELELVD